ncbi:MAG: HAD family phosphatase [bacterium]|nr:HAD family phosphatase [bacterium]
MPIQAFVFDMDGTLTDTEILWVEATERFLLDQGIDVTREQVVDIVYGIPWEAVYETIVGRFSSLSGMSTDTMDDIIAPHFAEFRRTRDIRIHSSLDLLQTLSETHPVCVVSGAMRRNVARNIETLGCGDRLEFFLAHEDYSPSKPHPAGYTLAAEKLGLAPEACLVFEDSAAGVQAAKGAGMHCVALARTDRPAQDVSLADLVLPDLGEFSLERYEAGLTD